MRDLIESAYDFELGVNDDDTRSLRRVKEDTSRRLNSWVKTESNLRHFSMSFVAKMIIYEVNVRKREYVVKRLLSRYSKLRRESEWDDLQRMMEEKNERERNRGISMSTSECGGRDSDKTHLVE